MYAAALPLAVFWFLLFFRTRSTNPCSLRRRCGRPCEPLTKEVHDGTNRGCAERGVAEGGAPAGGDRRM
jgi:hypothetical protein